MHPLDVASLMDALEHYPADLEALLAQLHCFGQFENIVDPMAATAELSMHVLGHLAAYIAQLLRPYPRTPLTYDILLASLPHA